MRKSAWAGIVLLCGIAPGWAQTPDGPASASPASPGSVVYYALETGVFAPGRVVRREVVRSMVDALVCGVTGKRTVGEAWRTLVSPADTVGIKVSAAGRSVSGTHPGVVAAIVAGLREAGVPSRNIIVWDRDKADLLASGYQVNADDYILRWVDPAKGYDLKAQVSAPVLGKLIWGDRKFGKRKDERFLDRLSSSMDDQLSSQSYFAKILSREVTKVINVPSLTDSYLTGINGALVSMTLGNLDNWRRFAKSAAAGDSYIAGLYADPIIREKVVLTILDALILQYAGGPFPHPDFAIENSTLFASHDPAAIDATAVRLIDEVRKKNKMPSVKPMTRYIQAGTALGLGEFLEDQIDLVRVGEVDIR